MHTFKKKAKKVNQASLSMLDIGKRTAIEPKEYKRKKV